MLKFPSECRHAAAVPSIEIVVSSRIAKKCDIRDKSTHFRKGALAGSVSMPSEEYLHDFSCIFRTSLIVIVKNRGGGSAVAPS